MLIQETMNEKRIDFELYKSNVCHQLKEMGDIPFIISVLESNAIRKYYKRKSGFLFERTAKEKLDSIVCKIYLGSIMRGWLI